MTEEKKRKIEEVSEKLYEATKIVDRISLRNVTGYESKEDFVQQQVAVAEKEELERRLWEIKSQPE